MGRVEHGILDPLCNLFLCSLEGRGETLGKSQVVRAEGRPSEWFSAALQEAAAENQERGPGLSCDKESPPMPVVPEDGGGARRDVTEFPRARVSKDA